MSNIEIHTFHLCKRPFKKCLVEIVSYVASAEILCFRKLLVCDPISRLDANTSSVKDNVARISHSHSSFAILICNKRDYSGISKVLSCLVPGIAQGGMKLVLKTNTRQKTEQMEVHQYSLLLIHNGFLNIGLVTLDRFPLVLGLLPLSERVPLSCQDHIIQLQVVLRRYSHGGYFLQYSRLDLFNENVPSRRLRSRRRAPDGEPTKMVSFLLLLLLLSLILRLERALRVVQCGPEFLLLCSKSEARPIIASKLLTIFTSARSSG